MKFLSSITTSSGDKIEKNKAKKGEVLVGVFRLIESYADNIKVKDEEGKFLSDEESQYAKNHLIFCVASLAYSKIEQQEASVSENDRKAFESWNSFKDKLVDTAAELVSRGEKIYSINPQGNIFNDHKEKICGESKTKKEFFESVVKDFISKGAESLKNKQEEDAIRILEKQLPRDIKSFQKQQTATNISSILRSKSPPSGDISKNTPSTRPNTTVTKEETNLKQDFEKILSAKLEDKIKVGAITKSAKLRADEDKIKEQLKAAPLAPNHPINPKSR